MLMNLLFSRQYTITAWELRAGELQIEPYFKYISLSEVWRMYWYLRRLRIETHQRIRWLQQQSTGEKKSVKIKAAAVIKLSKILWVLGMEDFHVPHSFVGNRLTLTLCLPKGRFRHMLIKEGRKCIDKGGADKKQSLQFNHSA